MAWDTIEYFKDHDTTNGWIGIGFILVPVTIGGISAGVRTVRATRWVKLSQTDIDALETSGQSIWKNGVEITPQMWTDYLANNPNTFPRFLRDDNGFYRTPLGFPVKSRIDEIRATLPPPDLNEQGNLAVADVGIHGLPTEYTAFSRVHTPNDPGALNADGSLRGFSYLKPEGERLLTGYKIIRFHRSVDTEAKILEDIAAVTDEATTGSIVLYTERAPCDSCLAVIASFREIRPNITLIIVYR